MKKKKLFGTVTSLVAGLATITAAGSVSVVSAATGAPTGSATSTTAVSSASSVRVQTNVMVKMRDGTELATDIYLPATGSKFPTLVTRTPYGKDGAAQEAKYLAEQGFAVVVQDCRGLGKSQGVYYPFVNDATDGYDTIEWAAEQPWSTGAVGTYGASALGIDQEAAALLNPPHLKAMFVEVATDNFFTEATYQGGAFRQSLNQGWLNAMNLAQLSHLKLTPTQMQTIEGTIGPIYKDYSDYALSHKLQPLGDFPYLNQEMMPAYQQSLDSLYAPSNPNYQNWEKLDMADKYSQIHVPVYHVGGFQDIFEAGVLGTYEGLQTQGGAGAKGNQKLLMGPWTHLTLGQGGTNTPWAQNAAVNLDGIMVQWFNHWLKGENNHIMQTPNVQYYVTGSNDWETAPSWPLPQAKVTPFYLEGEKSGTVKSLNDGSLSTALPNNAAGSDTYVYDPSKPTLTVGGNNLEISAGPADQSSVENGVLTYTSQPLKSDLKIVGPLSATLYASSSAVNTDFTVKLTDVSPDGKSTLIEDGIVDAKYRDGQQQAELLNPGQVYPFKVSLIAASHTFKKGDRIRVDVASSNYPRFAINPNTANENLANGYVVAQNTIYHSAQYPSAIDLPVVPNDGVGKVLNMGLGHQEGYQVTSLVHNSSTYLPIWYLMKELQNMGYQTAWNGHVWQIAAPGSALGDTSATHDATSNGTIIVNGQVVYTGVDKVVSGGTTYLSAYDVATALAKAGVTLSQDLASFVQH